MRAVLLRQEAGNVNGEFFGGLIFECIELVLDMRNQRVCKTLARRDLLRVRPRGEWTPSAHVDFTLRR